MITRIKKLSQLALNHRYGFTLFAFLSAAMVTGFACVWFMRVFEIAIKYRLDFARIGWWCWLTTPLLFILATEIIRRFAPSASGTGIPQAIFAGKNKTLATNYQYLLVPYKGAQQ